MDEHQHYTPPEGFVPGTVFDPRDETFGPIMAAIQAGEFGRAAGRLEELELEGRTEPARYRWAYTLRDRRQGFAKSGEVIAIARTSSAVDAALEELEAAGYDPDRFDVIRLERRTTPEPDPDPLTYEERQAELRRALAGPDYTTDDGGGRPRAAHTGEELEL